jgi:hypothetical protein
MFKSIIQKVGLAHSRIFTALGEKAKTSKVWAVVLTLFVFYELVEHLVYPWLVPWLAYIAATKG